jgi:hypothetical protein
MRSKRERCVSTTTAFLSIAEVDATSGNRSGFPT